jgi:hypothetical protein
MEDKQEVLAKWKEIALEFRFVTAINILQTDGAKNKNWGITLFPTIKYDFFFEFLFLATFYFFFILSFAFADCLDCSRRMRLV